MLKKFGLAALLIFCAQFKPQSVWAQYSPGFIYEDATRLYKAIQTKSNGEELSTILTYYFQHQINDPSTLLEVVDSSTFLLGQYLVDMDTLLKMEGIIQPHGIGTNLMGLNVTNYADGIAKFLIVRGKQEVSTVFFERMKNDLDKYPELQAILPNTTSIIVNVENHNLLNLLQELRDALVKDLIKTPQNLLSLRDLDTNECRNDVKCKARFNSISKIFTATASYDPRPITISLNLTQGIIDGNNIAVLINRIVSDFSICYIDDNFNGALKLTSILLNSMLTDQEQEGLFISETKLKNLFSNPDLLNIYFGLVYQKYNKMDCYSSIKINSKDLKTIITAIINGRNIFYAGITSFDNVNVAYKATKKQIGNGQNIDNSYYGALVVSSFSAITRMIQISSEVLEVTSTPEIIKISTNLSIGSDFCVDIQQRNYSGIFNDLVKFISQNKVFPDTLVHQKVIKYLSFASNMAMAVNSDEINEAINAVALPPGSFSIKQKSGWNASFNGYIGYNWDYDNKPIKDEPYAKGVYAPLGISISKGLSKKCGGAITVFASIIDVGAIAAYRLTEGMIDTLKQEIRFESIFAPGLQLFAVIPKTPIAFGFGWRATPKLFYSGNSGFITIPSHDVFTISVLIDIPIFNIYNIPYKN